MKQLWDNRKKLSIYLFCFLAAAVPLMICSKSSPLYPFNDWPDVNIFFTLGKGMMKGKVPYVDLLDHKGPYVYLMGGVAYFISPVGFQGYFLFELASMFCFILYSYRIIELYTKEAAIWVLPLLCAGIVSAKSFVHGGSIEELSLGIFAYAIYSLLSFLRDKENNGMPVKTLVWNGIWAGILFWSKFTLLGLYIVWFLVVILKFAGEKKWRELFKSTGIFLGAMLATTIPWLFYFGINNAVREWLTIYLWNNIFGYAQWEDISLLSKILTAIMNMLRSLKDRGNRTYSFLVAAGALIYAGCPEKMVSWKEKLAMAFTGLLMGIGIFVGETKHDYYGLPLAVFSLFGGLGLVMISGRITKLLQNRVKKKVEWLYMVFPVVVLAVCSWGSYKISPNTYLLSVAKEQMPQFYFAGIIEESSEQSVLNYGFLDGGFYTALNQVPDQRIFCIINKDRDLLQLEQNVYVREGRTKFVVAWKAYQAEEEELGGLPVVSEYYELVDFMNFEFEGDIRTYALYERKD